MKSKIIDLAVVISLIVIAAFASFFLRLDVFISVLLFLAVPSLFLCFRKPKKNYRKIILASVAIGILAGMAYNIAAEYNNAYIVHHGFNWLNYHFIGKTPIGNLIWAFLIPFSTIIFYEHFLDDENNRKLNNRSQIAFIVSISLFLLPVFWILFSPFSFTLPYAFFIIGSLSLLPILYLLRFCGPLIKKIGVASLFFIFLNLTFELVAIEIGHWSFTGQYIGWIELAGLRFPVEELIFWIIPSAASILICYEVFFDDRK